MAISDFLKTDASGILVLESMSGQDRDSWVQHILSEALDFNIPQTETWIHSARIGRKASLRLGVELQSLFNPIFGGAPKTLETENVEQEDKQYEEQLQEVIPIRSDDSIDQAAVIILHEAHLVSRAVGLNNPIEAVAHWGSGALRPLCVFDDKPMPYPAKVTATQSWQDIPTCKSAGLDMEYAMLRGIFMAPGVTQEQVDFYIDLFKKVRPLPAWTKYREDAAFNTSFMTGKEFVDWVGKAEATHKSLMQEAGFLAK